MGPVEHELAGSVGLPAGAVAVTVTVVVDVAVVVGVFQGVAAARVASVARGRSARVIIILAIGRCCW